MIPIWLLQWLGTLLGGIALLWIGWARKDAKDSDLARDNRISALEKHIQDIYLKIAGELPTSSDIKDINRSMDALYSTVEQIRDMVVRLEERSNIMSRSQGH